MYSATDIRQSTRSESLVMPVKVEGTDEADGALVKIFKCDGLHNAPGIEGVCQSYRQEGARPSDAFAGFERVCGQDPTGTLSTSSLFGFLPFCN